MSNKLSGEKKKITVLDHVFCQFQFTGEGNCTVLCLLPHSSAVYALLYMVMADYINGRLYMGMYGNGRFERATYPIKTGTFSLMIIIILS